jgi:DNA-binding MarR family transcriptional regulator
MRWRGRIWFLAETTRNRKERKGRKVCLHKILTWLTTRSGSICCGIHPIDNNRYNEYIYSVSKSIQAEIKQTRPFKTLEDEAVVALQRTADQLSGRFSDMLKPHGLSPTQYNALRILRGAGDSGRACREIAERMINRDPDITRLLDRLEKRGFVVRSREGKDRRVIITRITAAGLKLLEGLDRPIEEFNRSLLGHLTEQQLRNLIKLLDAARKPG